MTQTQSSTPALKKIWLTRHGESQFNAADIIGGNSMLTASGLQYARELSAEFRLLIEQSQGQDIAPVNVWTSTLKRTVQTASCLPSEYPQEHLPELDEINAGECDGLTYEAVKDKHPAVHEGRKKDKLRFRYPGGESYQDLSARVAPVIKRLREQEGYLVIVAHQAVARVLYASLMGIAEEKIPHLDMPLHTLFEFTPQPDGSFTEQRRKFEPPRAAEAARKHEAQAAEVPVVRRQVVFEEKCVGNVAGPLSENAMTVQEIVA